MNFIDLSKTLLNNGMLINVIYLDENNCKKHMTLMKGEFFKIFSKKPETIVYDFFYNIYLEESFILDELNIHAIEYPHLPEKFNLDSFLYKKQNIIDIEKNYYEKIKPLLEDYIKSFEKHINLYYSELKAFAKNDRVLADFIILRFYPKHGKFRKNLEEQFKKDIRDNYFLLDVKDSSDEEKTPSEIYALGNMFGVRKINENNTSTTFVNALKRQWRKLMVEAKDKIKQELVKTDISFFSKKEKDMFWKELKDYLNSIDVSSKSLSDLKTPKEVVSYWPPLLQPKPLFVYSNEE